MSEHPPSPTVWYAAKESHFFLAPSEILRCTDANCGVGSGWEHSSQSSQKVSKGPDPTVSWTSSGSLHISYWGCFSCRCPQLAHRHAQCSKYVTHISSYHVADSLCMPLRAASTSLCRQLGSMHRKLTHLCGIGRKHTYLSIQHSCKESKGKAISKPWPSFLESREGI